MTVKETIERLSEFPSDANIVVYSKCGPYALHRIHVNGNDEVVLEDNGGACEHLCDNECPFEDSDLID